jgi:peptidoglycan/LPS O-acetylase OafA/YrhL
MNKPTSLYLDAVRFAAALAVFWDHACGSRITGGLLWQLGPYGPEAVTVFFVLSGFVIAHATAVREQTLEDYAVARAARIYSVAVPALILTAVADDIGRSISPSLYTQAWHYSADPSHFVASGLFLNQVWTANMSPGSNWSYWSLGYEVWYYLTFAVIIFARGRSRWLLLAATLALAGPSIAVMMPLWLLGVVVHRLCTRRYVPPVLGSALFVGSLVAWAGYEVLAWHWGRLEISDARLLAILKRPELPQDYVVAACFAVNLIGFHALSTQLKPYVSGDWRLLRWLAGATFSLYLFHEPLLRVLATVNPWAPNSVAGRILVAGGTLAAVFALAEVTERRKGAWRRAIVALVTAARQTTDSATPVR